MYRSSPKGEEKEVRSLSKSEKIYPSALISNQNNAILVKFVLELLNIVL
jgi:hypothetical protein